MATFVITGPDGKKYKVTGDNAEGAMAALRKTLGQSAPAAQQPVAPTGNIPTPAPQGMPAGAMAELSALSTQGIGAPMDQAGIDLARQWQQFDSANPNPPMELDRSQPPPKPGETLRGYGSGGGGKSGGNLEYAYTVQDPRLGSGRAFADALSNGLTLGWGDELQAAVRAPFSDKTYGEIQGELQDRKELGKEIYPDASAAGNVTGGIAAPSLGVGKMIAAAPGLAMKTLAGAGGGGALGAIFGAGDAAAGERGQGALTGGLTGALAGGALTGLSEAAQGIFNSLMRNKAIKEVGQGAPTTAEARDLYSRQFKELADNGEVIPQADFPAQDLVNAIEGNSAFDKIRLQGKSATPGGENLVGDVTDIATDPRFSEGIGFDVLKQLRENASELSRQTKEFKPTTDSKIGAGALDAIDNVIDQLGLTGKYKDARAGWSRMLKSANIDDIMANADNYLSGTSSGITNQLKNLLKSGSRSRPYTQAEKEAMQAIIQGSPLDKVARMAGSGLSRVLGTGAGALGGGPVGAAASYAGSNIARSIADALTKGKTEALRKALVNGGLDNVPGMDAGILNMIRDALMKGATTGATSNAP